MQLEKAAQLIAELSQNKKQKTIFNYYFHYFKFGSRETQCRSGVTITVWSPNSGNCALNLLIRVRYLMPQGENYVRRIHAICLSDGFGV